MRHLLPTLLSALCFISLLPFSDLSFYVEAAELTDVIDAADGKDPFDFTGEVIYRRHLRRAKITREYHCNPVANPNDRDTCPDAPPNGEIRNVKELRYQRWTHEMVPRFHLGLWKDLEFLIEMPIVIQDEQNVRYAGDGGEVDGTAVTPELSSIAPAQGQKLFSVPLDRPGLPVRAGFGDMLFKFRFAPISFERDESRGEWVVELGYRAPTGTEMKFGNEGVGRGVHEFELGTSFSRRYGYVEPYASFQVTLPFNSSINSPFKEYWGSQEYILPGTRARFDMGLELIPYQNQKIGQKFFINIALGAGYQAEGRDYSELFDALAIGARSCDPNTSNINGMKDNCAFYNNDARNTGVSSQNQAPVIFDGITTVEQFLTVRGRLGFGFYVSSHFKIGANISLAHETEHNISSAEIGKDLDSSPGQEGVFVPAGDINQMLEHNPTFVPNIDYVGRRIRVEETTVFTFAANIGILF